MRHLKSGRKLNRTRAHRKALLHNLATQLFEHKRIRTTEAKAKELRPFAESIITRAKNAYLSEKGGTLPEGLLLDLHARRVVGKVIKNKPVLQELFDVIAPKVAERPGGYTRIIKTNYRRGDGGSNALIELVDWAGSQDGPMTINQKKKLARKTVDTEKTPLKKEAKAVKPVAAMVEEKVAAAAPIEEVSEVATVVVTEEVSEVVVDNEIENVTDVENIQAHVPMIEAVAEVIEDAEVEPIQAEVPSLEIVAEAVVDAPVDTPVEEETEEKPVV
jgi:large subunit ribosomal protein L17